MISSNKFLLLIVLYCFQTVCAQDSCVIFPDGFGRYLGQVFLEQKDITKEPFYTEEVAQKWNILSDVAKTHNVSAPEYTYYKTYFLTSNIEPDVYDLYLVFKSKKDTVAIEIEASKNKELWTLRKIESDFFNLINPRKNSEQFVSNNWITDDQKFYPNLNQTNAFSYSKDKKDDCFPDPLSFIKEYAKQLFSSSTVDTSTTIVTLDEYKETYIPSMLEVLEKAKIKSPGDLEQITKIEKQVKDTPEEFYKSYFLEGIHRISNYVNENQFSEENIDHIEFRIQNFRNELLGKGKILLEANIILAKNNQKEGIRCKALWYHNTWKIIYQQANTFGITTDN
ncbi:hypothetical protein [Aquimarina algicola]|uniref:Uncharacterized protein n=1 Tax=Aquimarina algicola TaxID=2589995 RepID=A0A504JAU1_9FLAO|nr:hypothetical protein [Aquimarina algicola]TPN84009.1 hypothetical protein FHK87_18780 [Aquimarina algicola]